MEQPAENRWQPSSSYEVVKPSLGLLGERLFDETPAPPPPTFPRKCFSDLYDNLGGLILLNAITSVLCLPLAGVMWAAVTTASTGGVILAIPLGLVASLPAAGAYGALTLYTGLIVEDQQRSISDYWRRGRTVFWRSWIGLLLQAAITTVILVGIGFYTQQPVTVFKLLGILLLSVLFIWILASMYIWPMIVRGYRWRSVLRNAFVLALASPVRTIVILVILLILTAVLIVIRIGFFFLLFSVWALFQNELFIYLRNKYGGSDPGQASAGK